MKQFNIHLVSDSTGETVSSVARAAVAQFDKVEANEFDWTLIRTEKQLSKVINSITEHPGVVMFTMVDTKLRDQLKMACSKLGLPCIPVLSRAVSELSAYLGMETHALPGKQHILDDDYFERVDAINYSLAHDDGQAHWELDEADIVVVGVSRTSKSPTCMYLANRGLKSANIPYVLDCPLPESLEHITRPLIVGLTINPDRLQQIRKSRLQSLNQDQQTNYTDMEYMQREIAESRKLYKQHNWPIIDVTKRSVEETAATIMQYHRKHLEALKRV